MQRLIHANRHILVSAEQSTLYSPCKVAKQMDTHGLRPSYVRARLVLEHTVQDLVCAAPADCVQAGMASSGLKDGWGLAYDGAHLLATESSAQVHWLDPESLAVVKSLTVTDRGQPIKWLNEVSAGLHSFRRLVWCSNMHSVLLTMP